MIPSLVHWHIEPSSRCALKCPRCPRAEVPDNLLNKQLDLNFFINQFGEHIAAKVKKITFCGNDGDPIYCTQLIDIISWFKKCNPDVNIVIITNGSYKSLTWWKSLGLTLNDNDEIHWSLDGWDQSSNEQYRIGSDWNSIIDGVSAFNQVNTKTYKIWAAIAFKFNQNKLDVMQEMSKEYNFDAFQLTYSTKFGSKYNTYPKNDPLEPDQQYIAQGERFDRKLTVLTNKTRPGENLQKEFSIKVNDLRKLNLGSVCLIGNKGVFLNSQGEFYPCCWVANRYSHNQDWINRAKTSFNLNNRSLKDILSDEFWNKEFPKFSSFECKTKCMVDRLNDINHTHQW